MKLTELQVRSAKPKNKDRWLSDGAGLYLRIRSGGSKKWIIRKKYNGKTTIVTLDAYPRLSLKKARLKAAEYALKTDISSIDVSELIEKYMTEVVHLTHKRVHLVKGYMDRFIEQSPNLGRKKVRDVSKAELVMAVQQYSKRGARTGDQLRSNLKKLFSYAVELGVIDSNPMAEVTRRISGYYPVARDRVLSDDEIKMLWSLKKSNANMLRFLLLTGLRISEARKGHRDGDRWVVNKEISKNGVSHWVHLTPEAIRQLPLPTCSATNIQAWLRRLLDKKEISPRFTPHDLRRTAATRMADQGIEPFIVERVLNHTLEGVMAVYNRAEYESERINAAKALEKHVLDVVNN